MGLIRERDNTRHGAVVGPVRSAPGGRPGARRLPFQSAANAVADSTISSFVHLRFYFQCLQRYIFTIGFNI